MVIVDRIVATPDPINPDRYVVSVFWKTGAGLILDSVVRNDDTSIGVLSALPEHLRSAPPSPKSDASGTLRGPRKPKG